jgi:hypothetical protein
MQIPQIFCGYHLRNLRIHQLQIANDGSLF